MCAVSCCRTFSLSLCILDCKSNKMHILHYTCSTYFGCYLHPSSGGQLQNTVMGMHDLQMREVLAIKWFWSILFLHVLVGMCVSKPFNSQTSLIHRSLVPTAVLWNCGPDDGCKQHPKHVDQVQCNKEYIKKNPCASRWTCNQIYIYRIFSNIMHTRI
jgi:hypothetical protein